MPGRQPRADRAFPESLTVRLPYGTRARIERAAEKGRVSRERFTREALLRALSRAEEDRPPERAPDRPRERPRGPGMD